MANNMRLTIGEFSKFCQVTVKTLRHYEKMGLLVPNEVNEWTRYRYYEVGQMQQLNGILRLKSLGFSLEEIRNLFDEGTHKPSILQIEDKIRLAEKQIAQLQHQLLALQKLAVSTTQINNMKRISIQRLPAITVASHRRVLKHREDLTPLFYQVISPEIQRIGCRRTLPIYAFTMDHEKEYKDHDIDTEYCLQVDGTYHDTPVIKFKRLAEVSIAICLKHTGPYDNLPESFAEVMHYINDNGFEVAGQCRIQYEEGLHNQKNPSKWITMIQVPVKKVAEPLKPLPNETYY